MKKISFLLTLFLTSCGSLHEGPTIYFSNVSPRTITNIQCDWAGKNMLSLAGLSAGDSRSQSFLIKKNSNFFGPVKISWISGEGESIKKEFYFKEQNLPSMADTTTYNYVQLYFEQDDLEIVSSDAPDLSGKTRKMDALMAQYRSEAEGKGSYAACIPNRINLYNCPEQAAKTSLIRVQPKKDTSLPGWLANSY